MTTSKPALPDGLHVRPATSADTASMIPVINEAFSIEEFLEGTRTDEERMADMWRKGEFLVAEDSAHEIAACVYTEVKGDRGYFGVLSVAHKHQGTGLGRLMIEAAEAHCRARGCKFIDIIVLSLRPDLPPLYRKFGYHEISVEDFVPSRKVKPGVVCRAIKMSKTL